MDRDSEERGPGSIELEVEIEARTDAVWDALTDPEKLANWLAPRVDGSGNEGARLTFHWAERKEHRSRIDVWRPEEHLGWSGWGPEGEEGSTEVETGRVDFHLIWEGDATVLKLVGSDFSVVEDRSEYFDTVKGSWIYFLYNLKYWLEEHPATRRRMIADRRPAKEPKRQAWRRIFGRLGLAMKPAPEELGPGGHFSCQLAEGVQLEGKARFINPPIHFAGSVDSVPGTLFFVELEPGEATWHCGFWISTYDVDESTRDRLKQGLVGVVDRLFGPETRSL